MFEEKVLPTQTEKAVVTITEERGPPPLIQQKPLLFPWEGIAAAVFFAAALVLSALWLASRPSRAEQVKGPPAVWRLPIGETAGPFSGPRMAETAGMLAKPVTFDEEGPFDVPGMVRAAAERAGFITPVYARVRRHPPRYLALVQQDNYRDQQGAYFLELLHTLRRRGVSIEIFTFTGDPLRGMRDSAGRCVEYRGAPGAFQRLPAAGIRRERSADAARHNVSW